MYCISSNSIICDFHTSHNIKCLNLLFRWNRVSWYRTGQVHFTERNTLCRIRTSTKRQRSIISNSIAIIFNDETEQVKPQTIIYFTVHFLQFMSFNLLYSIISSEKFKLYFSKKFNEQYQWYCIILCSFTCLSRYLT